MIRVLAAALALALAAGCGGSDLVADRDGQPVVVTSLTILADFARQVGGDDFAVHSLVAEGEDPHTYEPKPSDARTLAGAAVVLRNGLGLEPWLDRLLVHAPADAPIVTATEDLTPIVEDTGPFAGDPDPHLWMDPQLAARYVATIADALTAVLPERAEDIETRAKRYLADLAELGEWIAAQVQTIPASHRKLVTTHDAFRYFGDRYGLEVVGTIWSISTEREPSADELRRLVDDIRAHAVPAVFTETTINPRLMERIAADAGVAMGPALYGDSVGPPGSDADTYLGMMRANTLSIVHALGGEA